MSKWDSVSPGRPVIERLDREIAAYYAYRRRQRLHYIGIVLCLLGLCIMFTFFEVRSPYEMSELQRQWESYSRRN